MTSDGTLPFADAALARADAFIAAHPEISREGVPQTAQGSTNRVIRAGYVDGHGEETTDGRVVLKVFCTRERKAREIFGLQHWAATSLVPRLLHDVDETMIVVSHIPGHYLSDSREVEGETAWRAACRSTGQAIASLTLVPLSNSSRTGFEARFYEGLGTLESYLNQVMQLGRGITRRDLDFRDAFWTRDLDFVTAQLDTIFTQPRVLYHQDVSNLHVRDGRFMGCFDLEMCRVGCAAMQLGAAAHMFLRQPEGWPDFLSGWETTYGASLSPQAQRAAGAAAHLLAWREISRYLSYDGTPGSGYSWAEPADPADYRRKIERLDAMLGI